MAEVEEQAISKVPFFRSVDWFAFWVAGLIALVVYTYTLAPSVTLEDGGELAVAGDWLGVPHPPGYPSWTMLAWLFARIFSFVTFRGQPNPTWGIAFLSAFFGALAAGLAALLVCRSGRDLLHLSQSISHNMSTKMEHVICAVAGVTSSLLFAFTPIMWSQSVIVEVYSLNAFFLILVMLLVYMWLCRPKDRYLYWAALVFGIGLTNYQVLLLAALALAIVVMFKDFELFRDFAVVGGPITAAIVGVYVGILPAISHPTAPLWYTYLGLNGALLILAYYFLPRGKTVAITILLAQVGVAVYVYMPIVSDLRNPPMNWGYPRTWEGFMHAVSRGQYEQITPVDMFSLRYLEQIGTYLADLRLNFTMFISLVAFLPFCTWRWNRADGRPAFDAMKWGIVLTLVALCLLPFARFFPFYKIPSLGVFLLLVVGATMMTVVRFRGLWETHVLGVGARMWERVTTLVVALVLASVYLVLVFRKFLGVIEPLRSGQPLPGTFVWELLFIPLLILIPVLVVWGALHVARLENRFVLTVDPGVQRWMVSTLIAFVTLSLGLIALANLKMDIQDTFIQRVKFISSHLFFSFWIGYGLIFLLAYLDAKFGRESKSLCGMAVIVAALLPVIPIWANAYNERLILVYGGADQHYRDFGWQFGNYSLRGAQAILEELEPDEEPLPNPSFPPEMGPRAIFFGGTDPGRFVPTYMIYSADVRPDVHLITQNALADGTYMSVMRDLYGNDIWIPSVADSASAFGEFVREIEQGIRPPMPGVTIQNGRVQVSGVMGVMEINALLARQIFERNRDRHDFYVEESYVIRWMYPYLTPHGLIMKINRDSLPRLPQAVVDDDLDFWDWYMRRFLVHPMFRRDVVAQKSFSKLRSAVAGLYGHRGLLRSAEIAFLEALDLYPLSPEAHFRLAELYLRSGRFAPARALIASFRALDPANERADDFLSQIDSIEQMHVRLQDLEQQLRAGTITAQDALSLADMYRQRGQVAQFRSVAESLVGAPNMPSFLLFPLANMYAQAGMHARGREVARLALERMPPDVPPAAYRDAVQVFRAVQDKEMLLLALNRYLERQPEDWMQWMELARLQMVRNDPDAAGVALRAAMRFGGTEARLAIETNPALHRILQQQGDRRRDVLGIGR
ncbi:MAG: protein O-mannosyl-transferase family [Kiritimatiellia bacterium]